MSDSEVTVKDETEGAGTANVDTKSLVGVGGKTVHRQIVSLGDPDTFGQEASVNIGGELLVKDTDLTTELNTKLDEATFTTRINTQGQKAMASSTPVVIASDQSAVTVSGTVSVTEPVSIDDNAGSLTVDAPVGTPVANRLSDGTAFLTTTSGRLSVDASGVAVPVTDNSGSLTVDQATATNLKAEVVGPTADNAANPTAKLSVLPARANAAAPTWTEGNVIPLSTDLAGNLRTDVEEWFGSTAPTVGSKTSANSIPVVVASDQGNVAVSQVTASSLNAQVVGSIAHDTGDSGNPVKIGGNARQTNPTAVADNDRVQAIFDDIGRQVVIMDQVRDLVNDQTTTITASTAETTIFTQVASVFNDLVMLTLANTSATATRVDFRDTTAGSVRFSLYVPAGATIGFVPKVPLKQATVNTNWTAQSATSVTDLRIFVQVVRNV